MKILQALAILATLALTYSCGTVNVVVDANKQTDFTRFETFSFMSWQDLDEEIFSKDDIKLIRDAFVREFEKRGFKNVNSTGDLQVSVYLVTSEETAFSGYNDYVGGRSTSYSHYWGGWGYGYAGNTSKQQGKLVGTLILNVYDGSNRNQVWQAIATGTVKKDNPRRDRTIPSKVSTIMRQFPVRPK